MAAYEDNFMYVGTHRNGVGAFLMQLFGHKKAYKVEIQLLVDYSERRGRIDYYAPDGRSA